MFRLIALLFIIVVLLAGCGAEQGVVIITATPNTPASDSSSYDQSCSGLPGNGFRIKNTNPCLIGRVQGEAEDGTPQCRPEQFVIYSEAVTVDGYPDGYSGHAAIRCQGDGYVFPITLINGEWGFTTLPTTLDAGCHIVKMTGRAAINDPDHTDNYMAAGYLQIAGTRGEVELHRQPIPLDDTFEIVWPFYVDTPATAFITTTLIAGWGSALDDSTITLQTISIAIAPDGYCDGEIPEL